MRTTDLQNLELTIFHADIVECNDDGVLIYESGITIRLDSLVANKIAFAVNEQHARDEKAAAA